MELDASGWSGDGAFTQLLIDALRGMTDVQFVRVEDAPASRADAGFNFISNEVFVRFAAPGVLARVVQAARPMTLARLHAAAGTFDFENGLKLVQNRGEFMDEACAATVGGMAAMTGADENAVRKLAADEDVDVANVNSPGQIVISGELAKVEAAVAVAKESGIRRAMMLNVAGAYHSRLMESAYKKLGAALLEVQMQVPKFPVISNVTGREVETLPKIRQTLQDQVTSTVRWVDCMERLVDLGCDLFIELGPGGVLAGLLKRTRKDVEVISVGDPESVRAGAARLASA